MRTSPAAVLGLVLLFLYERLAGGLRSSVRLVVGALTAVALLLVWILLAVGLRVGGLRRAG